MWNMCTHIILFVEREKNAAILYFTNWEGKSTHSHKQTHGKINALNSVQCSWYDDAFLLLTQMDYIFHRYSHFLLNRLLFTYVSFLLFETLFVWSTHSTALMMWSCSSFKTHIHTHPYALTHTNKIGIQNSFRCIYAFYIIFFPHFSFERTFVRFVSFFVRKNSYEFT